MNMRVGNYAGENMMKCVFCSKEIKEDASFCPYCGKPVKKEKENSDAITNTEPIRSNEDNNSKPKASTKSLILLFIELALIIAIILSAVFLLLFNSPSKRYGRLLSLGEKFLQEDRPEEAILSFQRAVGILPEKAEAYEKLGDACMDYAEELLEDEPETAIDYYERAEESYEAAVRLGATANYTEELEEIKGILDKNKSQLKIDSKILNR